MERGISTRVTSCITPEVLGVYHLGTEHCHRRPYSCSWNNWNLTSSVNGNSKSEISERLRSQTTHLLCFTCFLKPQLRHRYGVVYDCSILEGLLLTLSPSCKNMSMTIANGHYSSIFKFFFFSRMTLLLVFWSVADMLPCSFFPPSLGWMGVLSCWV